MNLILSLFSGIPFYILDIILTFMKLNKPYYLLHVIHNIFIVNMSYNDVIATITDFHNLDKYSIDYSIPAFVVSFHLYHIMRYRESLRYDDWLHHGLMVGIAIPVGLLITSKTTLMSYSLFWSTGLPGAISYFSLFLQRNYWISSEREKAINTWMNVWIRSPGCVSLAILTLTHALSKGLPGLYEIISILPAALMYWNGQYFMQQAVIDYAHRFGKRIADQV